MRASITGMEVLEKEDMRNTYYGPSLDSVPGIHKYAEKCRIMQPAPANDLRNGPIPAPSCTSCAADPAIKAITISDHTERTDDV